MVPPVISCRTTSHAPSPRIAIWTIWRRNLVMLTSTAFRDGDGRLMAQLAFVVGLPAPDQAGHQVHRLDRFGIAESRFGGPHRPASRHSGGGQGLGRHVAVDQGQREQHHGGGDRHVAQDRVQQVDHRQIDRDPGGIEQEGDAAAEEAPQAFQVAERVRPVVPPRPARRPANVPAPEPPAAAPATRQAGRVPASG